MSGRFRTLRPCERRALPGRAGDPRPAHPYPEERRVLLRLVALLGCVLPGDAEEGLARVLPAQPSVAPALDLRHQPVAETQGTPGPRHESPAVGDPPFVPPLLVAGHRGHSAPGTGSGERGGQTPARQGIAGATWTASGGGESERLGRRFHFPFCSPEALSPLPVSPGLEGVGPHVGGS